MMNPRNTTSSVSKREKTQRNPFNRRNNRSISLRRVYISRSYSQGSTRVRNGGTTGCATQENPPSLRNIISCLHIAFRKADQTPVLLPRTIRFRLRGIAQRHRLGLHLKIDLGARLRRTKDVRDVVLSDTGAFETVEVARQRPETPSTRAIVAIRNST